MAMTVAMPYAMLGMVELGYAEVRFKKNESTVGEQKSLLNSHLCFL